MLDFLTIQTISENATAITLIYVNLLAFVLSVLVAWTYERTFRGLSYSRNYVQTLILISIVAATVMQAVGDSLARGLGIMAAMAVIRFRTNFKDSRDIVFMFAALSVGVATGVYGFLIAIIGTLSFCTASFVLYYSPLGSRSIFDGMLRFSMATDAINDKQVLENALKNNCKTFALVTLREMSGGEKMDYAYQIKLKNKIESDEFMQELSQISTLSGLSFMLQEATVEL
ncbi:MAG: DUF4956 domain-containing protein [Gammaproteobacteria bacterium]|nr:MAG: DUF4956 domain-containing protein [Gammaproteobacteria bacterium]